MSELKKELLSIVVKKKYVQQKQSQSQETPNQTLDLFTVIR